MAKQPHFEPLRLPWICLSSFAFLSNNHLTLKIMCSMARDRHSPARDTTGRESRVRRRRVLRRPVPAASVTPEWGFS